MFNSQPIYCPKCPTRIVRGQTVGVQLVLDEHNYSGCGVDMAECPQCGKCFQISYKVDEIIEAPWWDGSESTD